MMMMIIIIVVIIIIIIIVIIIIRGHYNDWATSWTTEESQFDAQQE
jgi:preprotein translocase subunit SecG